MKFTRLSTTSKLYLLTLFFIFVIIFINKSVFAQSPSSNTTSKRIQTMELYQSWIDSNTYGTFKQDLGNKALNNFKNFLGTSLKQDKECLSPNTNPSGSNTFIQNIQTFFSGLVSQTEQQTPAPTTQTSCTTKIKEDYKLAKKYNRLLKYLQIEEGQPNVCIRADLGVGTTLLAHGFNPAKAPSSDEEKALNPKETGRSGNLPVYLCTGNDGKKKVRVVDDSGTRLRLSEDDTKKPEFKVENLPPAGSLDILIGKLNLK